MDAGGAADESVPCGRRSRVVLTPRRWRQVGERNFIGDGGKKARSPGRARNKLLKPSRAGMPGDPGATVVTNACVLLPYTRGCGCNGHPAFPTPFVGREIQEQLARFALRERESVSICCRPGLNFLSSFRDAPLGAGPESILPAGVMDSGLARFARAPE
jgi:hypothetical protein